MLGSPFLLWSLYFSDFLQSQQTCLLFQVDQLDMQQVTDFRPLYTAKLFPFSSGRYHDLLDVSSLPVLT